MDVTEIESSEREQAINTIKMLSVDAVEAARSGHPGLPMGCSDIAFTIFMDFLRFNPADPAWPNRDRFVLSAGHGSALIYSLLHLFGYDLSLEEIKNFRQFGSMTPGHPEYGHTPGIETTTGPLGQGFVNGVGMAIAERIMAQRFNNGGKKIIDHYIYGIVSDGDLMEGLVAEGASIAGHLGLSKLIYVYDSNNITIEGNTDLAFSDNVARRFEAYNWHVLKVDGYNHAEIREALIKAKGENEKPSLIIARTHIGKGSPNKQDTPQAHGEPLGTDECALTKEGAGWPVDKPFYIPEEARRLFQRRVDELLPVYEKWCADFDRAKVEDKQFLSLWDSFFDARIPGDLEQKLLETIKKDSVATRSASGDMMQVISGLVPSLIGGSADLSPSTKTFLKGYDSISKKNFAGRNIHFGIREHAMGSILNGMAVYGGVIPFGSTFLVFSDYMRPAIRLAALMKIRVIYVFTHDSIFLGEDGPTHQPVEHASSLRAIPNLTVIRPSDATETAAAWTMALENKSGPTAMLMSRQNLPVIDRTLYASQSNLKYGAYTLLDCDGTPELILLACGSEVVLALGVAEVMRARNVAVRVVSVPSFELYNDQPDEYRQRVLPAEAGRLVAIEAGISQCWYQLVGRDGLIIGIDKFGCSAPSKKVGDAYGFTVENIVEKISARWEI